MTAIVGARRLGKIQTKAQAERFLEGLVRFEPRPQRIPYIVREAYFGNRLSLPEVKHLSQVMKEADMVGMLPEFGPQFTPHDEYEPPYVGTVADELCISPGEVMGCDIGCNCDQVGFSLPNPIKAVKKAAGGVVRSVKRIPVAKKAINAANKTLLRPLGDTVQKLVNNPIVTTIAAPIALPIGFTMAAAKNGPKGALAYARQELKNPVRGMVIKAAAVVFPPMAPAAVALEATNRVLDAVDSKDPAAVAKATAQIAATYALGEIGDPGALKAIQYFKQAKAMRANIPKGPLTPAGHPRVAVCGARSEEARGVWLKVHFYMDGPFMKATVYTVTGGDAEVFNLKVDTRPIAAKVAKYHQALHKNEAVVSGTMFENLSKVVKKVGRGKLTNQVFTVSKGLATKAKCKAMTPNMPVSDVALAAFASARKGVDAVDANAKMQKALKTTAANLKGFIAVKNVLGKMTKDQKVKAMKNPTVKSAVVKGIGAKFAAARFVKAGGPAKAKTLQKNAMTAAKNFAVLSRATKSANPAVKAEAKTMAKVVSIAAKARQKTKNVTDNSKGGMPGLVLDTRGRLRKGKFTRRTPGKGELTQVMLARGGVQTGIFDKVSGTDPFDIGVSEEPTPLLGCIGRAMLIGAIRCGAVPKKKPIPVRRAAPARPAVRARPPARPAARPPARPQIRPRPAARPAPAKRPLPMRNRLPAPKTPALKAIAKMPVAKRVAVAKKIAAKLTPAQREQLRQRIAAKRAAMGMPAQPLPQAQPGYPAAAYEAPGGGAVGPSFDDYEEEEYETDEEELDEEFNPDHEHLPDDSVVADEYAETEEEYGSFDAEDLSEDEEELNEEELDEAEDIEDVYEGV